MSEFAIPEAPKAKPPPQGPVLAYNKPEWSAAAKYKYSFEILKNGTVVENFEGPAREFITVGRLPMCDLELEHPSISRYHAVIQFNDEGKAFLYDLASGYGTKVNKATADPKTYVGLKDGDQIRFGESTRLCIFHTEYPDEKEDEEREGEVVSRKVTLIKRKPVDVPVNDEVTWGLPEDAVDDEPDVDENDLKSIEAAEKRAEERAAAQKERMKRLFGDDEDSDDDSFYDRTGAVEKHKSRKTNKGTAQKVETYDTLLVKQKSTQQRIADIEAELKKEEAEAETSEQPSRDNKEEDELDSYMENLDKATAKPNKSHLQKELKDLTK
ncbi:hypothetical protein INT43_008496, partial [Umbelopsis isabellina]